MCSVALNSTYGETFACTFSLHVLNRFPCTLYALNISVTTGAAANKAVVFDRPLRRQWDYLVDDSRVRSTIDYYERFFKEAPRKDIWNYSVKG
jgi:hypothetical protein